MNLFEAIDSHIKNLKQTLHTCIPAEVTAVELTGNNVLHLDVKPVVDHPFHDGLIVKAHTITKVPVLFPSGGNGMLSFPIQVGDHVLLMLTHADIQRWVSKGESGTPSTLRKFSLTDAVAIPCIYPNNDEFKGHSKNMELKFNDFLLSVTPEGDLNITVEGSNNITVNGNVSLKCNNADVEVEDLTKIKTNKFSLSNSSVELVQYLSDLTDQISKITVSGAPIDNKTAFEELKTKIDSLIGG